MSKKNSKNVPIKSEQSKKKREVRQLAEREHYWSPFEMMHQMEREMYEMWRSFDTRFGMDFPRRRRLRDPGAYRVPTVRQPLLDIEDTGKNLEIRAEVPGIPKENIDIKLTEDHIEISAKAQQDKEESGRDYYHRERSFHSFYRSVPLPTEVDQTKADAKLEDGILNITVPKRGPTKEEKAQRVKIK